MNKELITNIILDHPKFTNRFFNVMRIIPDKTYLNLIYRGLLKDSIDWENPTSYTQKLQWIKLHYKNALMPILADKYRVREYVSKKIGDQYLTKLYGVYDTFEEIDFDQLPKSFILKGNHGSGFNLIVEDKDAIDWSKQKKKIDSWLQTNYYYRVREWAYKEIAPKLTVEELLVHPTEPELMDYKFYTFNGEIKFLIIDSNVADYANTYRNVFTRDFTPMEDVEIGYFPDRKRTFYPPKNYKKMVEVVEKLAEGFVHVRVDLYNVDGRIVFGEMTFYPHFGMDDIRPRGFDELMGSWIDLDALKKEMSSM